MILYECRNFTYCGNYLAKPDHICEDCKKESVTLSRSVEYESRMETMNYIDKHEGEHRRRDKRGRR